MLVTYVADNGPEAIAIHVIRFKERGAEFAAHLSKSLCHPNYPPSCSVWLVPGTAEE